MKNKRNCLFALLLFLLGGIYPSIISANEEFVLASRQETLTNRFAERVLKEVYRRLNIDVVYSLHPGAQSIEEANAGRTDGEVARLETVLENYPNLRIVPAPLFTSDLSVFAHADISIEVDGWESLGAYKTTTIDGFKFVKNKLAPFGPTIVSTTSEAIKLVQTKDVEVAVLNRLLGVLAIAETQTKNVKVINPPIASKPVYHLVHKKHEALIPKLTATIQAMKNEGILDKMWESFVNSEIKKAYKLGGNIPD